MMTLRIKVTVLYKRLYNIHFHIKKAQALYGRKTARQHAVAGFFLVWLLFLLLAEAILLRELFFLYIYISSGAI